MARPSALSLSAQGAPGGCRGMSLDVTPPPRWTPQPHDGCWLSQGGTLRGVRVVPGTATLEMASGWLRVSTLTCWKPLQVALCRCLCPGEGGE